jgi:hypothetical protein
LVTTVFVFLILFHFAANVRDDRGSRINLYLCLVWLGAFAFYIGRALLTGVLYPG